MAPSLCVYALCSAWCADKTGNCKESVRGRDGSGRKETCHVEGLQGYVKAADFTSKMRGPGAVALWMSRVSFMCLCGIK